MRRFLAAAGLAGAFISSAASAQSYTVTIEKLEGEAGADRIVMECDRIETCRSETEVTLNGEAVEIGIASRWRPMAEHYEIMLKGRNNGISSGEWSVANVRSDRSAELVFDPFTGDNIFDRPDPLPVLARYHISIEE